MTGTPWGGGCGVELGVAVLELRIGFAASSCSRVVDYIDLSICMGAVLLAAKE